MDFAALASRVSPQIFLLLRPRNIMNQTFKTPIVRFALICLGVVALLGATGCSTPAGNVALGVGLATATGSYAPANEIEQIYYLGVFDPQEQIPPTIYRVTVHGQASFISRMKFGSGWVPARLIDSLSSSVNLDPNTPGPDALKFTSGDSNYMSDLKVGRRLMEFGPEGFREAPKDQRLVIVMGASPKAFFDAIDTTLGQFSQARAGQSDAATSKKVFQALTDVRAQKDRVADFARDVEVEMPRNQAN